MSSKAGVAGIASQEYSNKERRVDGIERMSVLKTPLFRSSCDGDSWMSVEVMRKESEFKSATKDWVSNSRIAGSNNEPNEEETINSTSEIPRRSSTARQGGRFFSFALRRFAKAQTFLFEGGRASPRT